MPDNIRDLNQTASGYARVGEEHENMTEAERERLQKEDLEKLLHGMRGDDAKEKADRIMTQVDGTLEEYLETRDALRKASKSDKKADADWAKMMLADVEKIIKELKELGGELNDQVHAIEKNFKKLESGKDLTITKHPGKGQTITTTIEGGAADFLGINKNKKPYDTITHDGTRTGYVIKDVNGDGKFDYDDLVMFDKQEQAKIAEKSNIFFPEGDYTFLPGDASSGTYTIKCVDKNGEITYYTFENAFDVTFHFPPRSFSNEQLAEYEALLPQEFMERCYFKGDGENSFYKILHPSVEPDDLTKARANPTYRKITDNLGLYGQHTDGTLDEASKAIAEKALAKYVAEKDPTKAASAFQAMMTELNQITDPAKRALAIQHLITAVIFGAPEMLSKIPIFQLETALKGDGHFSSKDIALLSVVRSQNPIGSKELWSRYFARVDTSTNPPTAVAGEYGDHASAIAALESFRNLMTEANLGLPSEFDPAYAAEKQLSIQQNPGSAPVTEADRQAAAVAKEQRVRQEMKMNTTFMAGYYAVAGDGYWEEEWGLFLSRFYTQVVNGEASLNDIGSLVFGAATNDNGEIEAQDSDELIAWFIAAVWNSSMTKEAKDEILSKLASYNPPGSSPDLIHYLCVDTDPKGISAAYDILKNYKTDITDPSTQ